MGHLLSRKARDCCLVGGGGGPDEHALGSPEETRESRDFVRASKQPERKRELDSQLLGGELSSGLDAVVVET